MLRAPNDGAGGASGIGHTIRGQYRLETVLGQGTLGTVYRALDIKQGRPVAIKLIDAAVEPEGDAARRMLADLETTAGLLNPHLVPALDAGVTDDGRLFVVEPLLAGQSLAERLSKAPIPPMETVRVALEVLAALDALHRHLLNHYDLHPGNIFIVRDAVGFERVLVGGVGQHHALALDEARGRSVGDTRARPEYLAPELISGKPRDVRTDLYQLGLVMYAALTGEPPFTGRDPVKVARRHALERPPSPQNKLPEAEIPDALDLVVVRSLEKVPRKRYSSAMEMTRALEQVARKGAAAAGSTSGRFAAVGLSGLHRLPISSAPPARAPASEPALPKRPLTGSLSGSADGSVDNRSPAGSVEDPPPFADFDAEPPPAGPQTQLDVRQLLSPPPKITHPPRIGEGLPSSLTEDRKARSTPPIASGRAPAPAEDDDDTAHLPASSVTAAYGNGEGAVEPDGDGGGATGTAAYGESEALSKTAVSSQTLVDPLFRPPAATVPSLVAAAGKDDKDDRDDTGAHQLSSFPGAALVGSDESQGVDTAEARAPTDELKKTMVGGPRPDIEAAVAAELSERTAFDGGAASKAAAAAVAVADAGEGPSEVGRTGDAGDDGPSELGAADTAGDEGWSVGAGALDDDIDRGLPPRRKAPWIVAALALIAVAAFALTRGPDPEQSPPTAEQPPEKISLAPTAPEPPPEQPAPTEPAVPEVPARPDTTALEAQARQALAAEKWRGSPDALVESLAALREANPEAPAIAELSTRGAETLLSQSRTALQAADQQAALDRARKALAVAPGFAPAERQIAEVSRLIAEKAQAEQAAAEEKAAEKKAAEKKAAEEKAAAATTAREEATEEKAARAEAEEKAAREKAAREATEQLVREQQAREKAAEDKAAADRKAAGEKAADDRRAEQRAAAEKAQAEAADALEAAQKAREQQADAERETREKAAAEARAAAEKSAREQAGSEARTLLRDGQNHAKGARWADAKQAFQQALERDGRLAAAHAGLGDVAFQQQRFAEAVTHHRRSVQYASRNAGYRVNLGMAYYKLQNWAQAKATWEKALEIAPDNAKAQRYLKLVEKKL